MAVETRNALTVQPVKKTSIMKCVVGFGVFMLDYLVARNLENRIAAIKKLVGPAV